MSCNQLLLESVICKTFTYHWCNVIITDRICSLFANKLSRMGKAMYKLGGRGRATQIKTWKGTTWTIDMKENEIVPKSKKRKAENVLVHNQGKRIAQMKADLEAYQKVRIFVRSCEGYCQWYKIHKISNNQWTKFQH